MPILFKDRVKDTSTDTGTGNLTIANSAPTGFITFNTAFGTGSGNKFYYCIDGGAEWEVGIGYLSDATTLVRETILASNSGSEVSFSAGAKTVFNTFPATHITRSAVLTADFTVASQTVPQPVTDLTITGIVSGRTYRVTGHYDGTAGAGGGKLGFQGGTATASAVMGHYRGTNDRDVDLNPTGYVLSSLTGFDEGWGPDHFGYFDFTFVASASGTLIVTWRQAVSDAADSTLKALTTITVTPVI